MDNLKQDLECFLEAMVDRKVDRKSVVAQGTMSRKTQSFTAQFRRVLDPGASGSGSLVDGRKT